MDSVLVRGKSKDCQSNFVNFFREIFCRYDSFQLVFLVGGGEDENYRLGGVRFLVVVSWLMIQGFFFCRVQEDEGRLEVLERVICDIVGFRGRWRFRKDEVFFLGVVGGGFRISLGCLLVFLMFFQFKYIFVYYSYIELFFIVVFVVDLVFL